MTSYLETLDPDQLKAVTASAVPTKVMAGAGSGKTRVLTCRVAHQIETKVAKPQNMFVAAFTRAAADEMKERVEQLVQVEALYVGTFHGIMYRWLNQEREFAGMTRLDVCKPSEQTRILTGLLGKASKDYPQGINMPADVGLVGGWIGTWKNELINPSSDEIALTLDEAPDGSDLLAAAMIYQNYEDVLKDLDKLDFDDMLIKSYELLVSDPTVLARAQGQWDSFFIDECQDTNRAQWGILNLLAPPSANPNLTVVGDTRQALYGFRGAHPELMDDFEKRYKNANVIDLTLNYRSTPEVIDHANNLISPFKMSAQRPHRKTGTDPLALVVGSTTEQAVEIAQFVQAARDNGVKGGDIAVLIRTNAQSADIESAFVAGRIPYWCQGGGFFDRMEIGDIMAYLRLALDHTDEQSLMRIINKPTRYLGKVFVEQVVRNAASYDNDLVTAMRFTTRYNNRKLWAKQLDHVQDLADLIESITPTEGSLVHAATAINKILKETDYIEWLRTTSGTSGGADDSRKENLDALLSTANTHGSIKSLIHFADEATALQIQSKDATEISTVHRSKGREWPIVVATNFYQDSIPHKLAMGPSGIADELRVAYVMFTRAQDHLVVMVPEHNEKGEPVQPSSFLRQAGLSVTEPDDCWWNSILV